MMFRNSSPKLHRALTYDPERSPRVKLRKRLLSEHQEESNAKKRMTEAFGLVENESYGKQNHRCSLYTSNSTCTLLQSTNSIENIRKTKTTTSMTAVETIVCLTKFIFHEWNDDGKNHQSLFITPQHLSIYLSMFHESENSNLLIVDCGIPFRYHERHITGALLLNITDRISRRRLSKRGLKEFLDTSQLERFNQSQMIILYDDSIHVTPKTCAAEVVQSYELSSSMKCLQEEIQRYDSTKKISILQSTFDDFAQHYPQHCRIVTSQANATSNHSPSSPDVDPDLVVMTEILPGLYLGSENDAKNRELLEEKQIGAVLNISTDIPCYYADEKLIEYRQIHCLDSFGQDILQYFDETFDFMKKMIVDEKKNLLVHCYAGISRSPSFVIGYLMKCHSKTFREAYQMVQSKRQIINPNLNFLSQLHRYEQNFNITQLSN